MIHKSSKDPVLVKKISLKGWRLSEELKAEIKSRLDAQESEESIISDLEKIFTPSKRPTLTLVAGDGEDKAVSGSATETSSESAETLQVVQYTPALEEHHLFFGRTFLSEITMENIHFFCSESFLEGQSIVLQFQIPKPFIVNVEVISARPYALNSRIISEGKLPYRVIAKFTFLKTGERALLRDFLTAVEPRPQEAQKNSNSAKAPDNVPMNNDSSLADLAGIADLDL
jgi:hypothetical protein